MLSLKQSVSPVWLFDGQDGITVREPLRSGEGNWVGAPGICVNGKEIYMTYRYRRPRGEGRGIEARIARSTDGVHFTDIWTVQQQELNTSSVERFALLKVQDGYALFLSYVDPADNRWRVDRVLAAHPDEFQVKERQKLFTAADIGLEAVKDPAVVRAFGLYWMILSCARLKEGIQMSTQGLHLSGDVYTTGLIESITTVAISRNGIDYDWLGPVMETTPGQWDAYAARISTIVTTSQGFVAYYDGGASHDENFEERTGIAISGDMVHWTKLSRKEPWMVSPHARGTFRYVDYAELNGVFYFYYEYARGDGSHELRVNTVTPSSKDLP
jgi:hypothetical protein